MKDTEKNYNTNDNEAKNTSETKNSKKKPKKSEKSTKRKKRFFGSNTSEESFKSIEDEYNKFDFSTTKHYKNIGFYSILEEDIKTQNSLKELRVDVNSSYNEKKNNLLAFYEQNVKRIILRLERIESIIDTKEESLKKHQRSIDDLEIEKEKILNEILKLKLKINDEFKVLSDAKNELIGNSLNKRLIEINSEYSKIFNNFQDITTKQAEFNKKFRDENLDLIKNRIQILETIKDQIQNTQKAIYTKIINLNNLGLSENVYSFLFYSGLIALVAAGWFFSIFVVEQNIQSQDYLSFLFSRVFAFGSEIFSTGNKFIEVYT